MRLESWAKPWMNTSTADLCRVAVEEGVPEVDQCEGEVLEEEVTEELAHSDVGPASVHQQEALQVTELGEGVVAGHDGLHPLLPADANTDICSWRAKTRRNTRLDSISFNGSRIYYIYIYIKQCVLTFDHVDIVGSVSDG